MHLNILLIVAIGLALVHFGLPLAYCYYLKKWLGRPWDLRRDSGYRPRVTIVVPTYNEASLIRGKLDNIASQDYPRGLWR